MVSSIFSSLDNKHLLWIIISVGLLIGFVTLCVAPKIFAQDPIGVSFTLEGCRDPSVDLEFTDFVCADADYTTGNLGKSWNELDLVPHRVTTSAGNSAPDTQIYTIAIVADYSDTNDPGYDIISVPVLNPVSDPSCSVVVGPELHAIPGLGGVDDSVYRLLTITQARNTTCEFDYWQRLAVGSHLFPGSSLHSNLANESLGTAGIGSKEVSIPVKEILPQELEKDMTATQDTEYTWNITKGPSPSSLNIENTCCQTTPLDLEVKILIEWAIIPGMSDKVLVVTNIYAINPAHRTITVNVTDEILGILDTVQESLDIESSGEVDVLPNTTQLVFTHTYEAPSHVTDLNDVATATYIDKVTGIPVSGQTTATASAPIQPGTQTNTTATITDEESISGEGLSYSVDSVAGAAGTFQEGYILGTPTQGNVIWISDTQNGAGYVEFTKTVYLDEPRITTGKISDIAILNGSDGFEASTPADVNITADAKVDLTIIKTIPDVLKEGDTASFAFEVRRLDDLSLIDTVTIDFASGELNKSVNLEGLVPGGYLVEETGSTLQGWNILPSQQVYIPLPECSGEVTFHNQTSPARAKVKKATIPEGFEKGWEFGLYRLTQGGPEFIEKGETDINGTLIFEALLEDGTYKILETKKESWNPEDGTERIFNVDLPDDAGKWFECTFTNKFIPSIEFTKTGDELSKVGDIVDYTITLQNTSPAGSPSLYCTITDTMLGVKESLTLVSGQTHQIPASYKVQDGDPDPLVNTAEVRCTRCVYIVVEASSTWSVNLFQPSIMVTKTGDEYSKVGDTVTYTVKIKNTSSSNTPNLSLVEFTDSLVPGVTPPAACSDLGPDDQCEFSYEYVVQSEDDSGEAGATLKNEATAVYQVDGFPNEVTDTSNQWSVELLHPDYAVSKECPDYPIPQEGPAIFSVIFQNAGDMDLTVMADEDLTCDGNTILAGTLFTLPAPAGTTKVFKVIIDGPFSGQKTVTNTINAKATLPEWTDLDNVLKRSGEDTCTVGGRINILKLTEGVVNPEKEWNFILTGPGLPVTGVQDSTLDDPDGVLDFEYNGFPANLDPAGKYTICELDIPVGWITEWKIDTNGDGIADTIVTPYNPDADDDPPQDLGNRCFDFGAGTSYPIPKGGTLVFEINNTLPGGGPRTPGYWKNWSTCTHGNQQYTAAANGGPDEGWYLLDDLLDDPGISWDGFIIATCEEGVSILENRDIMTGKKMANDAAYKLASHLLAAQLNFAAGAKTCQEAQDTALEAEDLLVYLGFNGTGNYLRSKDSYYQTALDLAETLDQYNNGILCNSQSVTNTNEKTTSKAVAMPLLGFPVGVSFVSTGGIAFNAPLGVSTNLSSPFGLGNTFSGAFGMGTGFLQPYGLALGQGTSFSPPFGLGNTFSGAFGINTGSSQPFGLGNAFSGAFGMGTGFSPPYGLALGQGTGFSPPFGLGNTFSGAFGMSTGFSPPYGLALGQGTGFSQLFGFNLQLP